MWRVSVLAPYLGIVLNCLATHLLAAQRVNIVFRTVPREVVAERLHRLHLANDERETELKRMFAEAGCAGDKVQEQVVRREDPPNIVCTLQGATDSLIIVGAHSDHTAQETGAVDDWSGASLLPSLYQAVKETPRRHTFMFVGFADEEKGRAGSYSYVKRFPSDRLASIKAMVNLECLGLGPTEVWAHNANKGLLGALLNITQFMHVKLTGMNLEEVGLDDTFAFREKNVPVITIHSVTQETWPILHSWKDNLAAIRLDSLYESYRVVSAYLAFLDESLN